MYLKLKSETKENLIKDNPVYKKKDNTTEIILISIVTLLVFLAVLFYIFKKK